MLSKEEYLDAKKHLESTYDLCRGAYMATEGAVSTTFDLIRDEIEDILSAYFNKDIAND